MLGSSLIKSVPTRSRIVLGLAVAALLVPATANAAVKVGSVYTETNDPTANQVFAFDRLSDGTLVQAQRIATGGKGEPYAQCPLPGGAACDFTDSQGAVALSASGSLLFAVNAGDNTISAFKVSLTRGLTLVDRVGSGGDFPNSLTIHDNFLYVLNQVSGSIHGFRFTDDGQLSQIPGSLRALVTKGASGNAAQIGFDRTGQNLLVTERDTNLLDTFPVNEGVAGPAVGEISSGPFPFGFAFDALGRLVVADASFGSGQASSYYETLGGDLVPISTVNTGGGAPCWVVITPDQRFAYITNSLNKSVAELRIEPDGRLTLLGTTPPSTPTLTQFPTDEALSRDGRFLYVLVPGVSGPSVSRIDAYRVGSVDGLLTFLASTPQNMPPGASGLAAR